MPSTLYTRVWHTFLFPQGKGGLIHKSLLKNSQKSEPPFFPPSRNLSTRSVLPSLAHHTLRSEIVTWKTTCGRFGELPFYCWLAGSLQVTGLGSHPSYTSLHCRSTSRLQFLREKDSAVRKAGRKNHLALCHQRVIQAGMDLRRSSSST